MGTKFLPQKEQRLYTPGQLRYCKQRHIAFAAAHTSINSVRSYLVSAPRRTCPISRRARRNNQVSFPRASATNPASGEMATKPVSSDSCPSTADQTRLYFCYGSNMVREKLTSRGPKSKPPIGYTEVWTARLQNWQLCFNLRGAPPREPAMASIRPQKGDEVYGLVYRIATNECWEKLILSEGVTQHHGSHDSYHVIPVEVESFNVDNPTERQILTVETLVTNPRFCVPTRWEDYIRPSQRYMNLLIEGAKQEKLPPEYIRRLETAPVARRWGPSILLTLMTLSIPFIFLMRRKNMRYMTYPLAQIGMRLYATHESLALDSKQVPVSRNARMLLCRTCLLVLYGLYAIPAIGVLIFDPRGRYVFNLLRQRNKNAAPEKSAKSAPAT